MVDSNPCLMAAIRLRLWSAVTADSISVGVGDGSGAGVGGAETAGAAGISILLGLLEKHI